MNDPSRCCETCRDFREISEVAGNCWDSRRFVTTDNGKRSVRFTVVLNGDCCVKYQDYAPVAKPPRNPRIIDTRESENERRILEMYEFTNEMGEISGFGGGYEACCRKMLKAALEWFDANPDAEPEFRSYEGVYGVLPPNNEKAEELSKAVIEASGNDCTGAMHQAVIQSAFWIRQNGWEKYVEVMSRRDRP